MINGKGARVGYIKFSTVDSTSPLWPDNYKWPAAKDSNGQVTDWNNGTYQEWDLKFSKNLGHKNLDNLKLPEHNLILHVEELAQMLDPSSGNDLGRGKREVWTKGK